MASLPSWVNPTNAGKALLAIPTGGASLLPGTNSLRDNPLVNFALGKMAPAQAGVGGPAADPSKLVQDSQTGMFYDPTTGTSYTDASGQTPITNPNVAQQVATNAQRATSFLGQLGGLEKERTAVSGQQGDLANHFRDIISGNAPSVAAMQAQAQANQAAQQQLAQAAGASGASAPLAALNAARNTGQVQIGANNAGAVARVGEQHAAMDALNNLLNAQGMGVERAAGRVTGAGEDFANLAATGQAGQQALDAKIAQAKQQEESKFGMSALKALATGINPAAGATMPSAG